MRAQDRLALTAKQNDDWLAGRHARSRPQIVMGIVSSIFPRPCNQIKRIPSEIDIWAEHDSSALLTDGVEINFCLFDRG